MGNIFVVTKASTLLIITQVSSGLKKSQMLIFSKYTEYLHVKMDSFANVKSCVTVGPISLMANVWPCIVPVD